MSARRSRGNAPAEVATSPRRAPRSVRHLSATVSGVDSVVVPTGRVAVILVVDGDHESAVVPQEDGHGRWDEAGSSGGRGDQAHLDAQDTGRLLGEVTGVVGSAPPTGASRAPGSGSSRTTHLRTASGPACIPRSRPRRRCSADLDVPEAAFRTPLPVRGAGAGTAVRSQSSGAAPRRRHSLGDVPSTRVKVRPSWACEEKPTSAATSATERVVVRSSSAARSTRRSRR